MPQTSGTGSPVTGPGMVSCSSINYKVFYNALSTDEILLTGTFTLGTDFGTDGPGLVCFTIPVPVDSVSVPTGSELKVTGHFNDANGNVGKIEIANEGNLLFSFYNLNDNHQEFDFTATYLRSPIPTP